MKALYLLAAATAIIATPAFAQDANNHDVILTVQGSTPAKCNIAGNDQTAQLANYDLTNSNGKARADVGATIGSALTGLNLKAWCTGGANGIVLTRTTLQKDDVKSGGLTDSGFAQNIAYDIGVKIDGVARPEYADVVEATEDGTSGPVVGRFGPTGDGAALTFVSYGDASTATSTGGLSTNARSAYAPTDARLVAGGYVSVVTLTLTPGL